MLLWVLLLKADDGSMGENEGAEGGALSEAMNSRSKISFSKCPPALLKCEWVLRVWCSKGSRDWSLVSSMSICSLKRSQLSSDAMINLTPVKVA